MHGDKHVDKHGEKAYKNGRRKGARKTIGLEVQDDSKMTAHTRG
jgi:hypothetical protein